MMWCSRAGLSVLFILLLTLLSQGCNRERNRAAQSNENSNAAQQTFADPQSAAIQSLAVFRRAVNAQNYKELGFESADEMANATLGPPLRLFFVRRDQLREYQPGADPAQLLTDFGEMNYPVMVKEQVRSSVVVAQVNGRWQMATLGYSALAKLIAAQQKAIAAQGQGGEQFLVYIGALELYFLGQREADRLLLTPLTTEPNLKLTAGKSMPGAEIFAILAPIAKSQSDQPT